MVVILPHFIGLSLTKLDRFKYRFCKKE
uniref:Uncharacterized protein n=1 Tax=Arundo donax TaxID=35708 RepID=A0A0A9A8V3_ARUDO